MKNKIYAKLFQFCDPKSWEKQNYPKKFTSTFYKEYKLEFKCNDLGWYYLLYKRYPIDTYTNRYNDNAEHTGFITPNKIGKFLFVLSGIFLLLILQSIFSSFDFNLRQLFIIVYEMIFFSVLSFFIFSIFNWKIYLSLRKAQNIEKIKLKESNEVLDKEIVEIVNNTIAKNPKLARKTKLKNLNKKFWQ